MKRNNKEKILSIIALVIALSGLTIGFAAFSSTLTISSSATVTPNPDDFDINIYGFKDIESLNKIYQDRIILDEYLDASKSIGSNYGRTNSTASGTDAIIDNITKNQIEIKNMQITFKEPDSQYNYLYVIKNEGNYPAYLPTYLSPTEDGKYPQYMQTGGECIAKAGTSQSLVDEACKSINVIGGIMDKDTLQGVITDVPYYTILPNHQPLLCFSFRYEKDGAVADGDFDIEFPTVTLTFTTTKPE